MPTRQFPRVRSGLKTWKGGVVLPLLMLIAVVPLVAAGDGAAGGGGGRAGAASRPDAATQSRVRANFARLPLSFEENLGQVKGGAEVKYLAHGSGYTLYLTGSGAVLALRQPTGSRAKNTAPAVLRMRLVNGNSNPRLTALDEQPGKSNYIIGKDPSQWRTGLAHYGRVAEGGVYPGIDLVYHGNQGQLEYDFELAPGADARAIRLALKGARKLRVDARGDLVVSVAGGDVVFHAPVAYQQIGGARRVVASRYTLKKNHQVAFRLAKYDRRQPLVIDPILAYSTYLGGSSIDGANGIAIAPDDTAFIAGGTFSSDFPTAHPLQPNAGGPNDLPQDAFVSKISADGSAVLYSTYLGGTITDYANGIAVDSFGNAYVTGTTDSADFPITPGSFNPSCGGDSHCGSTLNNGLIVYNGFATKLNPAGSALVYSGFIGTDQNDIGFAIAVDSDTNAYVTGQTDGQPGCTSPSAFCFPTTPNAYQSTFGGLTDGFVFKISATGSSVLYSSYLGGSLQDTGLGIAVDSSADAYVTGITYSVDFPTTPATALQGANSGAGDGFFAKINTDASGLASLAYSSYLGGTGLDQANAVAVDSAGIAYVTGAIKSTAGTLPFTLPGTPYQADCKLDALSTCEGDAFVAKIDASQAGSAGLVYFTYLGGSNADSGAGIAIDTSGDAYVTGSTNSSDFPSGGGAFQPKYGGGNADAFVTQLDPAGSTLVYSSFLGGTNTEGGTGIAVDLGGSAYVAGQTCSEDFPLANALQTFSNGNCDAFITKVSILAGIALNPAGLVFPTQSVGTTSAPQTVTLTNGNADLTITSLVASGDFAQSNTCGTTVPANSQCTITVTFTPTVAGVRKGAITITDSAPGSPHVISLTGSTSAVSLSASSLDFGTQAVGVTSSPQTVVVTNAGTTLLTISGVASSGDFAETNNCSVPLQPTTNCVITVTYTPSIAGPTVGAVTITDDASGSPQVILLNGTGQLEPAVSLSTSSLTFSSQIVNTTSDPQTVTITNTGTAPLTVSAITATAGFAETNTCTAAVAAGGICTVSVTFTPTTPGAALGSLTITDNAANSPQTVALTGTGQAAPVVSLTPASLTFANQDLGTTSSPQTITLKNTGGAALAVTSITASGDFAETNTCGSSVAAGASCTVNVTFTPTVAGSRNGSVTFADNAADSPQTVLLAGTGTAAPAVSLSAPSLNFNPQPVGTTSAAQTVTVTNSGTANLNITSVAATGQFSQTNTCGGSLAPKGTCVISVAFAPTTVGTASGTLTIADNAPDSPQTVSLGGAGSDFTVKTTPASGSIVAGSSASFKVTVTPSFGFNATVTIGCSGLPAASTCTVSPNSVTPDGVDPATATLTVGTTVRTMAPPGKSPWPRLPGLRALPSLWMMALLGILALGALAATRRRRRLALAVLSLTLLAILAFGACGGGSGYVNPTGTPAGNYTLTVTGTSGGLSHMSTISLTVQ